MAILENSIFRHPNGYRKLGKRRQQIIHISAALGGDESRSNHIHLAISAMALNSSPRAKALNLKLPPKGLKYLRQQCRGNAGKRPRLSGVFPKQWWILGVAAHR